MHYKVSSSSMFRTKKMHKLCVFVYIYIINEVMLMLVSTTLIWKERHIAPFIDFLEFYIMHVSPNHNIVLGDIFLKFVFKTSILEK